MTGHTTKSSIGVSEGEVADKCDGRRWQTEGEAGLKGKIKLLLEVRRGWA